MKRLLFAVCLVSGCQNEITPRHERHSDIKQYGKLATPYVWDESITSPTLYGKKKKDTRRSHNRKRYFQASPALKASRAIDAKEGTRAIDAIEIPTDRQ